MSADDIDKNLVALGHMKLSSVTKATYTNELLDEIYNDGLDLLR